MYSSSSANSTILGSNLFISFSFIPKILPFKYIFSLPVNSGSNPDVNSSKALTLPLTLNSPVVGNVTPSNHF